MCIIDDEHQPMFDLPNDCVLNSKFSLCLGIKIPEEASSPQSLLTSPSSLFRKNFRSGSKSSPGKQSRGKQLGKTFKSFSGEAEAGPGLINFV